MAMKVVVDLKFSDHYYRDGCPLVQRIGMIHHILTKSAPYSDTRKFDFIFFLIQLQVHNETFIITKKILDLRETLQIFKET